VSPHAGRRIDAKPSINVKSRTKDDTPYLFPESTLHHKFLRSKVQREGFQTSIKDLASPTGGPGTVARSHESYSSAMRVLGANRLLGGFDAVNSPVGSRLGVSLADVFTN
jgi:hypothetical protein